MAPRVDTGSIPFTPPTGAEPRRAPRAAPGIPFEFQSTLRFPRGERGRGRATDIDVAGARIRVDRALDPGEWVRIAWSPSLRNVRAVPAELRAKELLQARVTREIQLQDDHAGDLEYAFEVEFPVSRPQRFLALFDAALPWIGLALMLAAVSNVVWLRGNNLYYF